VLDHDSPVTLADGTTVPSSATNPNTSCGKALGTAVTTCGDITASRWTDTAAATDSEQAGDGAGRFCTLVLPDPVQSGRLREASGAFITLFDRQRRPAIRIRRYFGFPYAFNSGNGQLTISQNSAQPLSIGEVRRS